MTKVGRLRRIFARMQAKRLKPHYRGKNLFAVAYEYAGFDIYMGMPLGVKHFHKCEQRFHRREGRNTSKGTWWTTEKHKDCSGCKGFEPTDYHRDMYYWYRFHGKK